MSSLEYQTESTGQPMDDYDEILYCQLDVQVKAAKSELYSLLFEVPMGQRLALLERQREIDRFHSVKQVSN